MVRQTCLWRRASITQRFMACVCAAACALLVGLSSATAAAEAAPPLPKTLWNEYPLHPSGAEARRPAPKTSTKRAIKRAAASPADQDSSKLGGSARVALLVALGLSATLALALLGAGSWRRLAKSAPARSPGSRQRKGKRGSSSRVAVSAPTERGSVTTPRVPAEAAGGELVEAASRGASEHAARSRAERGTSTAEQPPSKPKRKRSPNAKATGTPARQRSRKNAKKPSAPDEHEPGQPTAQPAAQLEDTADQSPKRRSARARTASQGDEKPAARRPSEEKPASEGPKPARAKAKRKTTSGKSRRNKGKPAS
jgi:hypothetical protein